MRIQKRLHSKGIANKKGRLSAFVLAEASIDADDNGIEKEAYTESIRRSQVLPKICPVICNSSFLIEKRHLKSGKRSFFK